MTTQAETVEKRAKSQSIRYRQGIKKSLKSKISRSKISGFYANITEAEE